MRTSNWFYYAVCALALGLYAWSFRGQQDVGALPPRVQADSLQRLHGTPITHPDQADFIAHRHRPGTRVEVDTPTGRIEAVTVRAFTTPDLWITFITAFLFWSIALFVFAGRARVEWARVLFAGCLTYGLAIAVGGVYFPPPPLWPGVVRPLLRISAMTFTVTLFLHLAIVFPQRRPAVQRRPWLLHALYGVAVVVLVQQGFALVRYMVDPTLPGWNAMKSADRLAGLYLVIVALASCVLMSRSLRDAQLTRERQQAKWVWWGITVGASPFIFFYTLPRLLNLPVLMPLSLARLFAVFVPGAFAVAVAKYQFMNIDLIIRRSLIYAALAVILVLVYLVPATLIYGRVVGKAIPAAARYVPIVAALTAIALFGSTRRMIAAWVDRTFFKIRYDYQKALRSFQRSVAATSGQAELAGMLSAFLLRTLSPRRAAVAVHVGDEVLVSGNLDRPTAVHQLEEIERLPDGGAMPLAAVGATSLPEIERADFPARENGGSSDGDGLRLAQPIVAGGRRLGAILLGEKESERRYIEQDVELLGAVAAATATALERIDLVQKVAEERIRGETLDELNRLKNEFFGQVAHDLRTPITSIVWSTDNLLDGVAGAVADRQREYLEATRLSARQLDRLVNNLLDIAWLEEGRLRVTPGPVAMKPVIDEAVATLRPIAEARQVRVHLESEPVTAGVNGDRDRLVRVVVNMLENAIKYSPPGGEVTITLCRPPGERPGHGEQELTVRDHGPGIAPGEEERIFGHFEKGSRRPQSPQVGFGIGLYVVKMFVEMFGGTVKAANHPGGGAIFMCRLPECGAPGEETR